MYCNRCNGRGRLQTLGCSRCRGSGWTAPGWGEIDNTSEFGVPEGGVIRCPKCGGSGNEIVWCPDCQGTGMVGH